MNKESSGLFEEDSKNNVKIYPLKEAKIEKTRFSVFEILRKIKLGKIILDPDFQRNNVWDNKQKSELIESILMGIPIPLIYTSQSTDGNMQIIDGRQRLSALRDFVDNDKSFTIKNLQILDSLNGKKFNDLKDIEKTKIEDYMFDIYMIVPPTPDEIKFDIFARVNRGGTKINEQEMRNALYNGFSTKIIKEMSEIKAFKEATSFPNSDRMKDRYLITRFLAFYLLFNDKLDFKYTTIDSFLGKVMKFINDNFDKFDFSILKKNFEEIMNYINNNYGDSLFRFKPKGTKKRKISIALFESITYAFIIAKENFKPYPSLDDIDSFKNKLDLPERTILGVDSSENIEFRFNEAKGVALK